MKNNLLLQTILEMPADKLPDLPSPADEPNVKVRRLIARRLPPERLPDLPTPEVEPDAQVRRAIARSPITGGRAECQGTPADR